MKMKRQPVTVLLCSAFLLLTVLFFSPMEVFLANTKEITIPFRNIWWIQLLFSLLCAGALGGLALALPGRIGLIAAGLFLGGGVACYLQILFLNGGMPASMGDGMNITREGQILNLGIWIAVILAVLTAVILLARKKPKAVNTVMRFAAGALIAMQAVGFVSSALTTDTSGLALDHNLSKEGEFELSSGTNVVVFVIDSADASFFGEMLEAYPEMNEELSGWVWYPNAASRYSRTYPSMTYLLTGADCRFDKRFAEYVEDAFAGSDFLPGIAKAGTDIRIFTSDPQFVASSADAYVANSVPAMYSDIRNLRLPVLEKNLVKMALYKGSPYLLKSRFKYDIAEVNNDSFAPGYSSRDDDFNRDLAGTEMTVSGQYDKAYRLYYLQGIHPGVDWDDNLVVTGPGWDEQLASRPAEEITAPRLYVSLRGSMRNVELYIRKMKELGIYDRATIIVTADHGRYEYRKGQELKATFAMCPTILIKYPGSDTTRPLQICEAPVSHEDLFAAAEQGFGLPVSGTGSGKSPAEIPEGEERERLFYLTSYRTNTKGEVALLEYAINGNARDFDNWEATGNWWNIVYSANIVSSEEFPGF